MWWKIQQLGEGCRSLRNGAKNKNLMGQITLWGCSELGLGSIEDHRLLAVTEDAPLEVPLHGAGEDDALEIAAFGDQFLDLVAVRHAGDVLPDDGAVIENHRHVGAGCADQFHSPLDRGVIRARSDEGGKER